MERLLESMTEIVVSDTSVLINFIKINRLDLLANCSFNFLVTDHVKDEITDNFPEQLHQFQEGLKQNFFNEIKVTEPKEIELFSTYLINGKLGRGECSAIAVALNRKHAIAIDDNLAIKTIKSISPDLTIFRTQDLVVKSIKEGILSILEADELLVKWEKYYRFKLNIQTFNELL